MSVRVGLAGRLKAPAATTLLALLLPIFVWAPLTYPGFIEFHSGFRAIWNLNDLARHLTDLSWAPAIGQPYDLLRGERSFPYLITLLPTLAGMTAAGAIKLTLGISSVAGAWGVFGWARRRLGAWPALVAATVYAFWPLALATLYVRGALAEVVLLALTPWVLWATDASLATGRRWFGVPLALVVALALWTQTGLAVWLIAIQLVVILFARGARPAALLGLCGGAILGVLGLMPLLLRLGTGDTPGIDFTQHLVFPHQYFAANWGTGVSVPGPDDGMTFQLGFVAAALALFAFVPVTAPARSNGRFPAPALGARPADQRRLRNIALCVVVALIALTCPLAAPLWRHAAPLARTLTFPWQLLLLAGVWLAWLAGLGASRLASLWPKGRGDDGFATIYPVLMTLALLAVYGYLSPNFTKTVIPEAPRAVFGDNEIALLSAVVTGLPGPGGEIIVRTEWQALAPPANDYTIFIHAMTPDGVVQGQHDGMPQGGEAPTSTWQPGKVVSDQARVTLSADAPIRTDYRYYLGMYELESGQRLRAHSDDKVLLAP